MKQEVIQDFLNLPGIEGLALVDNHSRPLFFGSSKGLDFRQKQVLAQGVYQVLDITPETCQFFEFQFNGYQVYVHKVAQELVLLVLASDQLETKIYYQLLDAVKIELQTDIFNAIANVRRIVGETTLINGFRWKTKSNQGSHSRDSAVSTPTVPPQSNGSSRTGPFTSGAATKTTSDSRLSSTSQVSFSENTDPENIGSDADILSSENQQLSFSEAIDKLSFETASESAEDLSESLPPEALETHIATPFPHRNPESLSALNGREESSQLLIAKDLLEAINTLLRMAAEYLGDTVVTNYWKASRPAYDWLNNFSIKRLGELTLISTKQIQLNQPLTQEQQQWFQDWITTFIQRCTRIIYDFPQLVLESELDRQQKTFLFPDA